MPNLAHVSERLPTETRFGKEAKLKQIENVLSRSSSFYANAVGIWS